jgi:hypothetical protein
MQCMQPLEPSEMVEHLKQGLGMEAQVIILCDFLKIAVQMNHSSFIMRFVYADCTCRIDTIKRGIICGTSLSSFRSYEEGTKQYWNI